MIKEKNRFMTYDGLWSEVGSNMGARLLVHQLDCKMA
jgi:hypothetical protein